METDLRMEKEEERKVLAAYFRTGLEGPLLVIPPKRSKRLIVLRHVSRIFAVERKYTESEINELLRPIHEDYASLRRELVDARLIRRTRDGSAYWLDEGGEV